jgi:hypothetical protein
MTRLEDLQPNAAVTGILPDQAVTVVSTQWFGSEALEADTYGRRGSEEGQVEGSRLYKTH